jgi:hypothetical protein
VTHQLTFASVHDYGKDAIILPVTFRFGNRTVRTDAHVDTGATFCVFKRELGMSWDSKLKRDIPCVLAP